MGEVVLHVWASPHGERELVHTSEIRELQDVFAQYQGVRCESVHGNTEELPAAVRAFKSSGSALQVIHFSSHGESQGLLLEDGNTESAHATPERLRLLLSGVQVPLLVLAACNSIEIAQHLCDVKVCDRAIGTTAEVHDAVVRTFANLLYTRLLQGVDLSEAFQEACTVAQTEDFVLLPRIALHDVPILSATKKTLKTPHNLPPLPTWLNYEASASYIWEATDAITAAHRSSGSGMPGNTLLRASSSSCARAIMLEGSESGVGTSCIALCAAHRLASRNAPPVSGGIVWVQCAGVSGKKVDASGLEEDTLWTRIGQCIDAQDGRNGSMLGLKKTSGGGAGDVTAQAREHVLQCLSAASHPHLLVLDNVPFCECLQASCQARAALYGGMQRAASVTSRCSLPRPGMCAARVLAALLGLEPSGAADGSIDLSPTTVLLTTTCVALPHHPPQQEVAHGGMGGGYGGFGGSSNGYYGGMYGGDGGGGGYGGMLPQAGVGLTQNNDSGLCDLGALAAAAAAASPGGYHSSLDPLLRLPVSLRKGVEVCKMITFDWISRYRLHETLGMAEFRWVVWRDAVYDDPDPAGRGPFTGEALAGRPPVRVPDADSLHAWDNAVSAAAVEGKKGGSVGATPPSRHVAACPLAYDQDTIAKSKLFAPLGNFRALTAFVDLLAVPGVRAFTVFPGHTRRLRAAAMSGEVGTEPSYLGARGAARALLLPDSSKPVQLPVATTGMQQLSGGMGSLSLTAPPAPAQRGYNTVTAAFNHSSSAPVPQPVVVGGDDDDPREPDAAPAAVPGSRLSPEQRAVAAVAAALPHAPALMTPANGYLQLPAAPVSEPRALPPPDPFWYLDRSVDRRAAAVLLRNDYERTRTTGGFIVRSSSDGPQFLAISVNSKAIDGSGAPVVNNYKLEMLPGGGLVSDNGTHFRSLAELLTSRTGSDMNMCTLVRRDGTRLPKEGVAQRCAEL